MQVPHPARGEVVSEKTVFASPINADRVCEYQFYLTMAVKMNSAARRNRTSFRPVVHTLPHPSVNLKEIP